MNNNNTTYKDSPLGKIPSDGDVREIIGQPAGYKRIYGNKIPTGWKLLKLSDKAEIEYGISDSIDTTLNTGVKMLSLPNVNKHGDFILVEIPLIEKSKVKNRDYLLEGDLLFNWRNGSKEHLGKTAYFNLEGEYTHVGFLLRIRTNHNELEPVYLKSYINFLRNNGYFLRAKIQVNNTFNKEELSELPLMYPEPNEQKAIASLLSIWDKAITTTQKLITQKEQQKKWLMQMLLTGKKRLNCDLFDFCDGHDLKTDNKKSGKSFNHKNHGSDNWKELRLGEIFNRITRKNNEYNTNVVTISAQRGFVRQTDFFNKTIASEITDNYFLVEKGEFCYNKSYSNGYPWGATKRLNDFDKAVVTTLYICFGLRNSQKNSGDFFEHYFEANLLDQGLTKIAHEGGRAHGLLNVTPNDFFDLKITIPAFEEQTAIAQVLQAADKEIQLLKAKADKLNEQKKGLMQVLLTGKKRLTVKG